MTQPESRSIPEAEADLSVQIAALQHPGHFWSIDMATAKQSLNVLLSGTTPSHAGFEYGCCGHATEVQPRMFFPSSFAY